MAMQANAKNASFMVPAGRRLSRVDSKTLRASFKGESSDEMEAVMRNLARKDDKIKYNPKNLPIGWDGKPIPYWLYKLHGLGKEFKCEICGGASYWGVKAFEKQF